MRHQPTSCTSQPRHRNARQWLWERGYEDSPPHDSVVFSRSIRSLPSRISTLSTVSSSIFFMNIAETAKAATTVNSAYSPSQISVSGTGYDCDTNSTWWGRGDSNPHAFQHMILSHARLPIPTLPRQAPLNTIPRCRARLKPPPTGTDTLPLAPTQPSGPAFRGRTLK